MARKKKRCPRCRTVMRKAGKIRAGPRRGSEMCITAQNVVIGAYDAG